MKPTPPEDRELEEMSAEVSEHYRAAGQEEPPPRLDAAVRMAARREVAQPPRPRRNWQVPASIAAVLVLGVSVILVVREKEPPLPSMERPSTDETRLAKSAPPRLAMKPQAGEPQARERRDLQRERPSRERSARPERDASSADELGPLPEKARGNVAVPERDASQANAPSSAAAPAQAPAAPPALEQKQAQMADARASSKKKDEGFAAPGSPAQSSPRAEQEARVKDAPAARAEDWLRSIDALLAKGEDAQARTQLLDFRKQYPRYPLSPRLQALLPQDQR
jgi:hypothetical protein